MAGEQAVFPEVEISNRILAMPPEARDLAIAKWAMSYLSDYEYKQLPTQPEVVKAYYKLPQAQRERMNQTPDQYIDFWRNKHVVEYFESAQAIKSINWRNKNWLQWMVDTLPDVDDKTTVRMVLATHKDCA